LGIGAQDAASGSPSPLARLALRVPLREALGVFALGLAWALLVRPGPLSLPYFWDEADVYAPGAKWLADHDLDPTPGHFPDDWSRGHPQLLYVLAAFAFRAWGAGPAVGHALIVPFTALALAATYVLGAERAGRTAGAGAALLLATSPLFLSMGAFLLPEMPLAALTALALVLTARGHIAAAAGVGVALVALKETGVGPPIAIAGGLLFEALRNGALRRPPRSAALLRVATALLPVLALAAFFVWQRATAGYFVFPHHQHLFTDRPFGLANALTVFPSLLLWHGRWIVTACAAVAILALVARRAWPASLRLDATLVAILLLLLGNAVFFAKMFWLERYALPVHPGVCVLLVTALVEAARLLSQRAKVLAAAAPCALAAALGVLALREPGQAPEHTFAFADIVETHRTAYARIAQLSDADPVVVTTWPMTTELREPWLGFVDRAMRSVHPDRLAEHPSWQPSVVLVDPTSGRSEELRALAREHRLRLRSTVRHGTAPRLELWSR
jgi:hypothetical protein